MGIGSYAGFPAKLIAVLVLTLPHPAALAAGAPRDACLKDVYAESQRAESLQLARELVENLERVFSAGRAKRCTFLLGGTPSPPCLDRAIRTTGYSTYDDFVARLREDSASESRYAELVQLVEAERLQVAIILDESRRSEVIRNGILNGHQSGVFRGTGNPGARNEVEAVYADMADSGYSRLPAEVKPKYGLIRPARGGGLNILPYETTFGKDAWVLRLDRIRDRLTWSPGDSLNRFSVKSRTGGYTLHATFWDQLFVPWKYRLLLAPFFKQSFEGPERVLRGPYPNTDSWPSGVLGSYANGSFAEIQVFGPIGPEDIGLLEYGGLAPSNEQAALLERAGIKVENMVRTDR